MPRSDRSTSWVLRLWLVVGALRRRHPGPVLAGRHPAAGPARRDPGDRLALTAGIFAVLVVDRRGAADAAAAGPWAVLTTVRQRWTRRRLLLAAGALLAYHVVYFCYHNLKSWDVLNQPRDRMLLAWDRWLFLGHSPAVLLHDLLGQHVAAYVADGRLRVVLDAGVDRRSSRRWCSPTASGTATSSSPRAVGVDPRRRRLLPDPVARARSDSAPQEFAGLPHTMVQDTQARYLAQRAHLLAHPHAHDAFAQVSAFASLHVAVTCVILLMARYYRLRPLTLGALGLPGRDHAGHVYLGWHFAVDDVAGALIAVVSVAIGKRLVYPRSAGPVRHQNTRDAVATGARAR